MKHLLAVAVLALAACSAEEHEKADYSQIVSRYAVQGDAVTCDAPIAQGWLPEGGPYTSGFCEFACVSYGTADYQRARVDFTRASPGDPWLVWFGSNTPGNCP